MLNYGTRPRVKDAAPPMPGAMLISSQTTAAPPEYPAPLPMSKIALACQPDNNAR